jgi:predicted acetyltransferase
MIIPASEEQSPILANLLELYAHDFSEFHALELGADGRFGYPQLPLYWRDSNRHPFLVKVDGNLAGLVLVKQGSEISSDQTVWDMAEFFIVRRYRRRGVGTGVAHDVWRRFPGCWEIRVMDSNRSALGIWRRATAAFVEYPVPSIHVEKGDKRWNVFSFESPLTSSALTSKESASSSPSTHTSTAGSLTVETAS